jgi:hypothetical protein
MVINIKDYVFEPIALFKYRCTSRLFIKNENGYVTVRCKRSRDVHLIKHVDTCTGSFNIFKEILTVRDAHCCPLILMREYEKQILVPEISSGLLQHDVDLVLIVQL